MSPAGAPIPTRALSNQFVSDGSKPIAQSVVVNPADNLAPPFAMAYCTQINHQRLLAVTDEEGCISILDTAARLPQRLFPNDIEDVGPRAQWHGHQNAIFDLAWLNVRTPASVNNTVMLNI